MLIENKSCASVYSDLRRQAEAQSYRRVDVSRPVWIFGAGNFGCALAAVMQAHGIVVAGFVETKPKTDNVQGFRVLDWDTLAKLDQHAQLALGILNHRESYKHLVAFATASGLALPLMPWELYDQFGSTLGWRFWLSKQDLIINNIERLARVAERLADDESREVLLKICAFRLGLDLEFSKFLSDEPHYFNNLSLTPLHGVSITYIDCGAYNGDTYAELEQQQGISCKQAFLLEPDPDNYVALVSRIEGKYPNAVCLPLAAADKYSIMSFSAGHGEGSAIGAGGNIHIAAVALDQIVPQAQVDFIKLDVEGAEALVLEGARKIVERCRPVLAVSLYHNPQDIWELPELLLDMCQNYKLYVRQHCFNSFESVLYAVPEPC